MGFVVAPFFRLPLVGNTGSGNPTFIDSQRETVQFPGIEKPGDWEQSHHRSREVYGWISIMTF